ncbi:MAG: SGNH/GDSL hydrolase family protein [Oscillospiraceae bacterium]|nr:SGNH/GDSL hydrolase family protein [Oscillospiraceae bacterium]
MKILFVGTSITKAVHDAKLGWKRNCGLAASREDKDFVHLTMDGVHEFFPESIFEILDASEYEKNLGNFDITEYENERDFEADIIVVQMMDKTVCGTVTSQNFTRHYERLVNYLNRRGAMVFCMGSFWENEQGEEIVRYACARNGYTYVKINDLYLPENRAGDKFTDEYVSDHPSDAGMKAIAERVVESIRNRCL